MFRDILIVFENQQICPEALSYGRELARRMDAGVAFIMLAQMRFMGRSQLEAKRHALNRIEENVAALLNSAAAIFIEAGIEVSTAFRFGDPAQELLKYLADREPFQAIIWGSTPDLPGKGHWIWRTSGVMECPLLAVIKKQ
jgi:nucleotide-binding universal stress UspA family protein